MLDFFKLKAFADNSFFFIQMYLSYFMEKKEILYFFFYLYFSYQKQLILRLFNMGLGKEIEDENCL